MTCGACAGSPPRNGMRLCSAFCKPPALRRLMLLSKCRTNSSPAFITRRGCATMISCAPLKKLAVGPWRCWRSWGRSFWTNPSRITSLRDDIFARLPSEDIGRLVDGCRNLRAGNEGSHLGLSIIGMATRASIHQRSSRKRHFSSLKIHRLAARLPISKTSTAIKSKTQLRRHR